MNSLTEYVTSQVVVYWVSLSLRAIIIIIIKWLIVVIQLEAILLLLLNYINIHNIIMITIYDGII